MKTVLSAEERRIKQRAAVRKSYLKYRKLLDPPRHGPIPNKDPLCRKCGHPVEFRQVINRDRLTNIRFCRNCSRQGSLKWQRANRDKMSVANKEYRQRPTVIATARSKYRSTYLRKAFGITIEDYDHLVALQSNLCAICSQPQIEIKRRGMKTCTDLHIDHDHDTGKIRGLLCHHCNTLLGHAKDSIEVLEAAIAYLKKSKDVSNAKAASA